MAYSHVQIISAPQGWRPSQPPGEPVKQNFLGRANMPSTAVINDIAKVFGWSLLLPMAIGPGLPIGLGVAIGVTLLVRKHIKAGIADGRARGQYKQQQQQIYRDTLEEARRQSRQALEESGTPAVASDVVRPSSPLQVGEVPDTTADLVPVSGPLSVGRPREDYDLTA